MQEYTAGDGSVAAIVRHAQDGPRVAQVVHGCTCWFNLTSQTGPVRHIQDNYRATRVLIEPSGSRFYATYFLVQVLFDKIFVGDEEIVSRDPTKFSACHEPCEASEHCAVNRAWCAFRRLTPPNG